MTTTAETERALVSALHDIRDHWPALMVPSGSGGVASKPQPKALYTLDDDDERDHDLPPADRRIDLRREVTLSLNSWARVVVDDNNLQAVWKPCTHGIRVTLRRPLVGPTRPHCEAGVKWAIDHDSGVAQVGQHVIVGTDTLGLIVLLERWARWFSGHEAAEDAVAEIRGWAGKVQAAAVPQRREWMPLGACPIEIEEDVRAQDQDAPIMRVVGVCAGQVRAYPGHDPRCQKCGTEADVTWWERVMFPDAELSELVTADELVLVLHRAFGGAPVKPSTIRKWISRGVIEPTTKDDKGRTLFNRGYVVRTLAEHQEGAG